MTPEGFRKRACNVEVARILARRELPGIAFDFIDGGAEDEISLRRNESLFDRFAIAPRPFERYAGTPSQSITLFGRTLEQPVVIGPAGLAGLSWPEGELAVARAAEAAGTMMIVSHGSTCTFEEVAAAGCGPKLLPLFLFSDRAATRSFAERAKASGYFGVCLTIDNQVAAHREWDIRNGFTVPARPTWRHAADFARHPGWLWRMGGCRRPTLVNYAQGRREGLSTLAEYMPRLLSPDVGWKDVAWLRSIIDDVLVIKGILHPDDARRAIDFGADGIIVSNHGGRQLDRAMATIEALPPSRKPLMVGFQSSSMAASGAVGMSWLHGLSARQPAAFQSFLRITWQGSTFAIKPHRPNGRGGRCRLRCGFPMSLPPG